MPINKSDYPENWDEISLQVRTEAGFACEWCKAPADKVIRRNSTVGWELVEEISACPTCVIEKTADMTWGRLKFYGLTRIIIGVAHLDRDSSNNERHNLAALCQRCHLRHDIKQHFQNRLYGRYHKAEHQLKLWT